MRVVDAWGILNVEKNGALMSNDFTRVTVTAPGSPIGRLIEGDGWTLQLEEGWSLQRGHRPGDYLVERTQ
jgi:hypothetical protein